MGRFDVLGAVDQPALEAFLAARPESSMFLRANLRAAGIVDRGKTYQATYVGARRDDGELAGVAAHCWNGKLILQAPEACAPLARAAVHASAPRAVSGLIGPYEQLILARRALGLDGKRPAIDSRDGLYALDLEGFVPPKALAGGGLAFRPGQPTDRTPLVAWRRAYHIEVLGATAGPRLDATARTEFDEAVAARRLYVLTHDGKPVATTAFNAALPDMVQIGGVYTPPGLRGRGYARVAVAASLASARAAGARKAILFTSDGNTSANKAYMSLGFKRIGDYGLILF